MEDHSLRRRAKAAQLTLMSALDDLPLRDVREVCKLAAIGLAHTAFALNASLPQVAEDEDPFNG